MGIFNYNEKNKTYTYPILKIIICIALIIVFINRGRFVHIDNKIVNIIIRELCTIVGVMCIYCIYISVCELSQVHENRVNETICSDSNLANSKQYTIDEIILMAETNDIIEIKIVSRNRVIEIGSSSDCKNGSSKFFDKLYYIDDEVFETIKDFKSGLLPYAINGQITVVYIDGIAQE